MPPSNDFCLKWNDHHNVFFASAEQLCASNALCDVTLSAGGAFFQAHKLVLSICSDYFQKVFSHADKGLRTVIYMKDVDAHHMELMLSYMYRGEITVKETELVALLNTASDLQVKGLSEMHQDKKSQVAGTNIEAELKPADLSISPDVMRGKRKSETGPREENVAEKVLKVERPVAHHHSHHNHHHQPPPPPAQPLHHHQPPPPPPHLPQQQPLREIKQQPQQQQQQQQPHLDSSNIEKKEDAPEISANQLIAQEELTDLTSHDIEEFDYDEDIAGLGDEYRLGGTSYPGGGGGGGRSTYQNQNTYFDYENKQVSPPAAKSKKIPTLGKAFQCSMCQMSFDQKWLLKRHYRTHTRERPYRCSLCNRTFSLRDSCLRHIRNIHRVEMESGEIPQSDVGGFCQFDEGNGSIVDSESMYGSLPNEPLEDNEALPAITNQSAN